MENLSFKFFSEFSSGIIVDFLKDAYSFDKRYEENDLKDWEEFNEFFFNNIEIANKYGFVTCLNDTPIGFISWDPRHRPEFVEIGYNCICEKYKNNGFGKAQLQEAVNRIKKYDVKKIIVTTDDLIPAQKMYEAVGFKLNKIIDSEKYKHFYYEMQLK